MRDGEATATDGVLLAIDQGTSSSRAIAFSTAGSVVAMEQQAFEQLYPASGWVEHDVEVIWATVLSTVRAVMERLRQKQRPILAIGLTNQRETTVVWDRRTGVPLYNAIVWQDRRTAQRCRQLMDAGHESEGDGEDGAAARSLFLGDQAGVDPGPRPGRTRNGASRSHRFRHGG